MIHSHAQINYCPISNVGATCNITAWAGPTGAFHAGTEDFNTCHQLCLSTATCQSFQVSSVTGAGIIPQCNLYTVSAGGSVNGTKNFNLDPNAPFIVYDRACAWALPVCSFSSRNVLLPVDNYIGGLQPTNHHSCPSPGRRRTHDRPQNYSCSSQDYDRISKQTIINNYNGCLCNVRAAISAIFSWAGWCQA